MGRRKEVSSSAVLQVPIGKASEDALLDGADYLNNHRALAFVGDGCKPSYKRLIWSALQFPRGELQPSVKVINNMASTHPHSLAGVEGLHAVFVKSGVFKGSGSFGTNSILGEKGEAAAPRYTKSCLSELYYDMIKPLLQCIDLVDSPVGPKEIPYVPLPQPLCLFLSTSIAGIGVGISTNYPNFSPESMYRAYINDDPMLLEPNIDLLLDKQNSELRRLWETGKGRVIYSYRLGKYTNEDGKVGYLFEGSTDIFTPNLKKINKYVEKGEIFIEDMTTKSGPKMFIGLVNNRGITINELETLCRQCCYDSTVYNLNVTDGKTSFRIPLKDWLDYTYKNYIQLLHDVNVKKIEKTKFDIMVQEALPIIADYILNKNPKATDKEICDNFGMSEEIVKTVMEKPISQLRKNKDNSARIKSLKDKLRELKKFNPVNYVEELIKRL